jgi:hypothetical protein
MTSMNPAHVYEIRPRKDDCGVNLISDVLPLRCAVLSGGPDAINNAIDYAKLYSRSHVARIRVYDEAGNVIETHEHAGELKEWWVSTRMIPGFPRNRIVGISYDSA